MKEFELIELFKNILKTENQPKGMIGIGDDCAVIPLSYLCKSKNSETTTSLLISTDSMVERRHFLRDSVKPKDLGWKLMAQACSDVAAMGGRPLFCSLALNYPETLPKQFLEQLYKGIAEFSEKYSVTISGGDSCSTTELSLSATVIGTTDCPAILRSGAAIDDKIWVSGAIGGAGFVLESLNDPLAKTSLPLNLLSRLNKPEARIELGSALAKEKIATAMIDISDGLIADLGHLLKASKVGALLQLEAVPLEQGIQPTELSALKAATAGEDYELLFAASSDKTDKISKISAALKIPITQIGKVRPRATGESLNISIQNKEVSVQEILQKYKLQGGWEHGES